MTTGKNRDRKQRYARMASEADKTLRNALLDEALGEGAENLVATGKKERVKTKVYVAGDSPGADRVEEIATTIQKPRPIKEVALPLSQSRAAKRARLKASRIKIVSGSAKKHPCGNIGCPTCQPAMNANRLRSERDPGGEVRALKRALIDVARRRGAAVTFQPVFSR